MSGKERLSRRGVLRRGAIATGGALAVTTASGSVVGGRNGNGKSNGNGGRGDFQGGTGFLDLDTKGSVDEGDRFTVHDADEEREYHPDCNGQGTEKDFQCYQVVFCGEHCEGVLCINPERRFETADDHDADSTHELTRVHYCPDQNDHLGGDDTVYEVSFQPLR